MLEVPFALTIMAIFGVTITIVAVLIFGLSLLIEILGGILVVIILVLSLPFLFINWIIGLFMGKEYLILKDQNGKTIKVDEETYRENLEVFQDKFLGNEILPSWVHKYQKGNDKTNDH